MSMNNRLRIAFVVHMYNKRMGHSRYVAELAERYVRQGHEVHVFATVVDEPRPPGIRFHYVPAWPWKALTFILSFILPATFLVRGRFDVIHAQGLCGLRQTVTTAHYCGAAWLNASRRLHGRLSLSQQLFRLLVVPMERLTFTPRFSPQVIAISESNRQDLARYYGRTQDVEVIHHGIDLERFNAAENAAHRAPVRERLGLTANDPVALYVGDLKKGAIPAIRCVGRTPAVHLVFVSPSQPEPYRDLVRKLGLERRIHFCPASAVIHEYFAAADVFLFPTHFEPFGLVILEAMASGLPVITSRAAGASELVTHGEDGWLVDDAWDVDQLADALGRLVGDLEMRTRIGRQARRKAEQCTWDRVAERTLEVYRRAQP